MKQAGKHALLITMLTILCLAIPSLPLLSCSSPSIDTPSSDTIDHSETARLISGIAQANSIEERVEAINSVVEKGYSLGLLDENGNQLNENVAENAVSLTPEDIAAFAGFVDDGRFQTVGNIVNYLAEIGVVLDATGEVVTIEDILPDIQEYVDWAFTHPDDPDSQLGILLASGPGMQPPASVPQISAETQISPMAAVLMLGDILIGTETETEEAPAAWNPFVKPVYAEGVRETAVKIQGLITKIESSLAKPVSATVDFLWNAGKKYGWVDKDAEIPVKIEIPPLAKKLISAFAFGNYFQVRVRQVTTSANPEDFPYVKSVKLNSLDEDCIINLTLVLAPVGYAPGAEMEVVEDLPSVFTARLLSPYETGVGQDLYPDANAIMIQGTELAATAADGHILDIAKSGGQLTGFSLKATKLDNDTPRIAILHTSASILTGDLAAQFEKYKTQYGGVIKSLGLQPEELDDMFEVLKRAVKVSPWMVEVILGQEQVTIIPNGYTGEVGDIATFLAAIENWETNYSWGWEILRKDGPGYEVISPKTYKTAQISLTFPKTGTYLLTARLYDGPAFNSVSNVIGEATIEVTIKPKDISLEIETTGPDITGPGQPLVQKQEYTFIARTSTPGNLPENPLYIWYFPDGTQEIPLSNEVTWAFPDTGNYLVGVDLYDGDNPDKPITSASIDIKVIAPEEPASDYLTHLQQMKYFDIDFMISGTIGSGNNRSYSIGLDDYGAEVSWDGVNFYVSWNQYGRSGTATGRVSPDGAMIEEMTLHYEWDLSGDTGWYRLEIAGLPLWEDNHNDMFIQRVDDRDVQKYVTSFTTHESFTADWDGEVMLYVYFAKTPF